MTTNGWICLCLLPMLWAVGCTPDSNTASCLITTQQLHKEIFSHKHTNKAIIITSRHCGHCDSNFEKYFNAAIDSCGDDYQFFVIMMDSMSIDSARAFYHRAGYEGPFYVLSDNQPTDIYPLLTALLPNEPDSVLFFSGLPYSGIIDRNNQLVKQRIYHPLIQDTITTQLRITKENLQWFTNQHPTNMRWDRNRHNDNNNNTNTNQE
ncbi:MAG: hypothetical protein HUK17_01590 [Bacteroidales bacterium]|nr:hypothetical protein [Bacteroidales bacterium]